MSHRGPTATAPANSYAGPTTKGRSRASKGVDVEMARVTSHPAQQQQQNSAGSSAYYDPKSDSANPSPQDRVSINSLTGGTTTPSRSLLNSEPASNGASPASFTVPPPSPTARAPVNRASATPSISSLIDPNPTPTQTSAPTPTSTTPVPPPPPPPPPQQQQQQQQPQSSQPASTAAAPAATTSTTAAKTAGTKRHSNGAAVNGSRGSNKNVTSAPATMKKEPTTNPPSSAPSPKPSGPEPAATATATAPKKVAPAAPVPRGNGLLSTDMFGKPGAEPAEPIVPTIYIHVPLKGETNKYVNFSKLAEEKYGWAACHPSLARIQERLASTSGDGMDSDSDSGGDGDKMALDSAPEGPAPEPKEGEKPKRKKRRVIDAYDANDPFIDDTETMWEEQAAATKDGFFVYSGPLIKEGEAVMVERADGTVKRGGGRGRGRGRGRGGAGAAGGATRKPRTVKPKKDKEGKVGKEAALASAAAKA